VGNCTLGLPAAVGLFRPKIIIPSDFYRRYSEKERALILFHERTHISRGDLAANAAAAVLQSLFWFHPLAPAMARLFRVDQELSCDETVLAMHPNSRRTYGEAMLKALTAPGPVPLSCRWNSTKSTRERFMQLNKTRPRHSTRMLGVGLIAALTLTSSLIAWASTPSTGASKVSVLGETFNATIEVTFANGVTKTLSMSNAYGKQFGFSSDEGGAPFAFRAVVTRTDDGKLDVQGLLENNGTVSRPHLIGAAGSSMVIRSGETRDNHFAGTSMRLQFK
jgi:hypothetical protein